MCMPGLCERDIAMLLIIVVVLLILAVVGGGWGYPRYGYVSASPFVALVVILLILWALGILR